jgi:general secretion pathway protein A
MLSNLQTETAPLIQIAMVGQPELREKLRHPSLEQLKQRVTVSYHLGVMNRQETGEYIQHRLNKAGAKTRDMFDEDAIDLIHLKSNGVPRTINILCDAALVYGYADEAERISREIVEQVIRDREDKSDAGTESYYASQDSGEKIEAGGFLEYRLSALESKIGKLQAMIDVHEAEINERMDSASDRLVQELEKLLSEERMRSQRLEEELADSRIELKKERDKPESAASDESAALSENAQKSDGSAGEVKTGPEWLSGRRDENQGRENSNEVREKKSKFKWLGFSRD